jgi:hypothetical protein
MYLDATAAIPQVNLENDNDSSGSHPLDTQQVPNPMTSGPSSSPLGGMMNGGTRGDEGEKVTLHSNQMNTTFGGCTPGLRRRREGADKYATDTTQLGLRFQRRRRHMAGNHDLSNEEDKSASPGIPNGIAPLIADSEAEPEPLPLPIFKYVPQPLLSKCIQKLWSHPKSK